MYSALLRLTEPRSGHEPGIGNRGVIPFKLAISVVRNVQPVVREVIPPIDKVVPRINKVVPRINKVVPRTGKVVPRTGKVVPSMNKVILFMNEVVLFSHQVVRRIDQEAGETGSICEDFIWTLSAPRKHIGPFQTLILARNRNLNLRKPIMSKIRIRIKRKTGTTIWFYPFVVDTNAVPFIE